MEGSKISHSIWVFYGLLIIYSFFYAHDREKALAFSSVTIDLVHNVVVDWLEVGPVRLKPKGTKLSESPAMHTVRTYRLDRQSCFL